MTAKADERGEPGLVSVVIPIYNHASFIIQCLESVAGETWADIEIVAIDDGSSDDSLGVARRWAHSNAHRFRRLEIETQPNVGITRTLNRLVRKSSGEFVVPLASDDVLQPGGIAARVAALRKHPEWFVVFGDCHVIDAAGRTTFDSALFDYRKANRASLICSRTLQTELVWRWTIPGPVLMVRREAYFSAKGIGLYDEKSPLEDRDFYLRALFREAIGYVDTIVASYRIHGKNTGAVRDAQMIQAVVDANRRWRSRFGWLNRFGLSISSLDRSALLFKLRHPTFFGASLFKLTRYATSLVKKVVLWSNTRRAHRCLGEASGDSPTHSPM